MLRWLGYGAAAGVSGDCDDSGGTETVEALALDAESFYGPGQLSENAGEMPVAGRSAADITHDAGTRDAVEDSCGRGGDSCSRSARVQIRFAKFALTLSDASA